MMDNKFEEEVFESDSLNTSLWKEIFGLMKSSKKRMMGALVIVTGEAMIGVILPLLNRHAIDVYYSGQGSNQDILFFALGYAALVMFQAYLIYQFIYQSGLIEMDVSYNTRQEAMKKLQVLPFSYYDKTPSGWLMARVTSDIARLSEILSWSFIDLLWGIFMMIMLAIVMFVANWKLALVVVAIVPFVYFISAWFQKRILKNYRKTRAINSKITSGFSEGISGAKTTKTMALERLHYSEFTVLTSEMRSQTLRAILLSSLYVPIIILISSLGNAGVIVVGGEMVVQGLIQVGTLIMFTQYAGQFYEPLRNIANILASLQMAQASAERVLSMLNSEVELTDTDEVIAKYGTILEPKEEAYEDMVGHIEFKDVDFYYNPEEPILKNFNLKVEPKQRIALVGETGSGKSTIVNLICRFYEPRSGEILIDGKDYRERSIAWMHSHLGYVLQAPHLFDGTVKENIRYGRLNATDEEIVEAAKLVDAHDFIMQLDNGYDSDVGEGGGRLSTGQKQLISFARALIAQPSIFVLDEATSSIDTETEAIIQHAVDTVLKEKTSFIIAHRLSTIVNADRILVIRYGEIIEDGTHQELLALKGYYHKLYTNQFNEAREAQLMSEL